LRPWKLFELLDVLIGVNDIYPRDEVLHRGNSPYPRSEAPSKAITEQVLRPVSTFLCALEEEPDDEIDDL